MQSEDGRKVGSLRSHTLCLAIVVFAAMTPACRRIRRRFHHAQPVSTFHEPAPECVGARSTARPLRVINAPATVLEVAVAASGRRTLVAAIAGNRAVAVGSNTAAATPIGTPEAGDVERGISVTTHGEGFAAAWRRQRASASSVVLARLDANGRRTGGETSIATDVADGAVAVAASSAGIALLFARENAARVQLVGSDGALTGTTVLLPGSTASSSVALAAEGAAFVAAWSHAVATATQISLARIDAPSGELHLLSAIEVPGTSVRLAMARGEDHILVAWRQTDALGDATQLFDVALQSNGIRLIPPQPIATGSMQGAPTVAASAHRFAIAWTSVDSSAHRAAGRWLAIENDGRHGVDVLDVLGSDRADASPIEPAMTWDGAAFVLARATAEAREIAVHRFGERGCDARVR